MNDQNLNNNLNQNDYGTTNMNLNPNIPNNMESTNVGFNQIEQNNNVETLEISNDNSTNNQIQNSFNDFNSFIKPPEIQQQSTNDLLNSVPKPDMMVSSPTSNSISTDDLLKEFVGKNYEKISKRKFNLSALFLGGTYFLYRKMIMIGILFTLLMVGIQLSMLFINPIITLVLSLILSVVFCLVFNKMYINNAKKNIEIIKKNNTNKSITDLKKICNKKGGTNVALAIIIPMIISSILSGIILTLFPSSLDNFIDTYVPKTQENNQSSNESLDNDEEKKNNTNTYNGIINYNTGIKINDKINIGYLQVFSPSTFNSDYTINYEYLTTPGDDSSKCSFKLSVINGYESASNLIDEMANYHNSNSTISTLTTNNNIEWNTFKLVEELETTYYNATMNNNLVYILEYNINSSANAPICEAFYNGVINSIEFK